MQLKIIIRKRMAKLIKNKTELDNFNIGFEFEFYVADKFLATKEKIPADIQRKYGHLFTAKSVDAEYEQAGKYFLSKLQEYYPETVWTKCFDIHEESSLDDTATYTGVEMVMKHEAGSTAMKKLQQVITVLNLPDFKTAVECGLHVNISFKDRTKNREDLAFDVSCNLEMQTILTDFKRNKNQFCVSNKNTTIDSYTLTENLTEQFENMLGNQSSYTLDKVLSFTRGLTNGKEMKKFAAMLEDSVKSGFISAWEDERPAVAPKEDNGKNYLEFRLMGGKDYQKKYDKIENGIGEFLKAMKKSVPTQKLKLRV